VKQLFAGLLPPVAAAHASCSFAAATGSAVPQQPTEIMPVAVPAQVALAHAFEKGRQRAIARVHKLCWHLRQLPQAHEGFDGDAMRVSSDGYQARLTVEFIELFLLLTCEAGATYFAEQL